MVRPQFPINVLQILFDRLALTAHCCKNGPKVQIRRWVAPPNGKTFVFRAVQTGFPVGVLGHSSSIDHLRRVIEHIF
jgi:hypothetical protein